MFHVLDNVGLTATPSASCVFAGLFLFPSGPLSLFSCALSQYLLWYAVHFCAYPDLFLSIQQTSLKFEINIRRHIVLMTFISCF